MSGSRNGNPLGKTVGVGRPMTHRSLKETIEQVVDRVLEENEPTPEEQIKVKRKNLAVGTGKAIGVLGSVALSAYLGLQQAVTERPTKAEVRDDIAVVKDVGDETEKRVDAIEKEVGKIGVKVDSLEKSMKEGLEDIKEELKYLRRRRRR